MKKEEKFNEIVKEARKDPNVIGLFLGGGRGKGEEFVTKHSDYDTYIIVKDKLKKKYGKRYYLLGDENFDFIIKGFDEFKKEDVEYWARYSYAHVKAIIDKNKKIQKIIDKKAKIPKEEVKEYVKGGIDGYINYVYRSIKCLRDKQKLAARLEANKTIEVLLNIIFAMHEGRTTPYFKHLEWELKKWPLRKYPLSGKKILFLIKKIIDSADKKSQKELFLASEKFFRKKGYGRIFDSWGNKLDIIKE